MSLVPQPSPRTQRPQGRTPACLGVPAPRLAPGTAAGDGAGGDGTDGRKRLRLPALSLRRERDGAGPWGRQYPGYGAGGPQAGGLGGCSTEGDGLLLL